MVFQIPSRNSISHRGLDHLYPLMSTVKKKGFREYFDLYFASCGYAKYLNMHKFADH